MIELGTKKENQNSPDENGDDQYNEVIEVSAQSKSKDRSKSQGGSSSMKRRGSMSEMSIKMSSSQNMSGNLPKYTPPYILKLRKFLDCAPVQITMTTLTIYILFADDIKSMATSKNADAPFSSICIALMGLFFIELVLSAIAMEDYFLGFYFWLDFISLVSMLLDVHWFYDWMINSISGGNGGKQAKTIGAIAKAGKSAKIAARAIRILRILRIIRLVRISKLYKAREKIIKLDMKKKEMLEKEKEKENQDQPNPQGEEQQPGQNENEEAANNNQEPEQDNRLKLNNNLNIQKENSNNIASKGTNGGLRASAYGEIENKKTIRHVEINESDLNSSKVDESSSKAGTEDNPEKVPEESKVGKILADRTTKKVIILVLAMMIGIILFNSSFYLEAKTGMEYGLKIFPNFDSMNDPNINLTFGIYITENIGTSSPIIYAKVGNLVYGNYNDTLKLRDSEKNTYTEVCSHLLPTDLNNSVCEATFDIRSTNRLSALLNIIKTLFICVVLSLGSYCFSKDTTEMVVEPIETMIQKVKEITKNPIEALQKNEKDEITKAILEEEEEKALCNCIGGNKQNNNKKKEAPLETEMLESTIAKIGALLALSFGDAGSEIIAKNMQKNSSGEVNPMIAGKKVCAIYGFCDIRNFTDTTEILQEKVMVFVNEIAEIVHEISSEYGGSANKNVGDAFLLVWKFAEKFTYKNKKTGELTVYNCEQVNQLCDMALISIIMILAKIYKSKTLDKYRRNDKLNKKFHGYQVRVGFGIHLGWSIEGAIGSSFKIDASYLSPNANMANNLEEGTKEYGVLIVMSDKFVENLSEEAQKYCRMIDIVNEDEPLGLFTVDIDLKKLTIEDEESESQQFFSNDPIKQSAAMRKIAKYQKRLRKKKNYDDATSFPPKRHFWNDFVESSVDFNVMRKDFTPEFYRNYNEGFDEYQFGDWKLAKTSLEAAYSIKEDPATKRMLDIMKKSNYVRPKNWKGI